jgi:hypothetical protein
MSSSVGIERTWNVGIGNRAVGARLGHVSIEKGKSLWRSLL